MGCNSCNNKKENIKNKEGFNSSSNTLSKYWIFIVIGLIFIIFLIYIFILRPKPEVNEFILAPNDFIRGRLEDYTVDI
jgi:hypothetical protein